MKTTSGKTIPFKQREDNDKDQLAKAKNNSNNISKVIPYPKYRRRKEKGIKLLRKHKMFVIILGLVLFFIFIAFLDNTLLKDKYNNDNSHIKPNLNNLYYSYSTIDCYS